MKGPKEITSGPDNCVRGRPHEMPVDKVKLHYVVHYMQRGHFDKMVPEIAPEEKQRQEKNATIMKYLINLITVLSGTKFSSVTFAVGNLKTTFKRTNILVESSYLNL